MDKATLKLMNRASRTTVFMYALSTVALPVSLLDIAGELNLSLARAGALSFGGAILQFIFLLAAIPIAGTWGKIRPLRWALWIMAAGTAAFTRAQSFATALAAILVIAGSQGIIEALLSPLIEDIHPEDNGSNQALLHAFWPMGVIFGTLTIGELLSRGMPWRSIFLGLAVLGILTGSLYPSRKKVSLPKSRSDFSHAGEILSSPLFRIMSLAIFAAGGAEGGITYWSASYIRLEFASQPRSGALGTAFFALGMAAGRILTSRLAPKTGIKPILYTASAMGLAAGLGVAAAGSLWALYVLLVMIGVFLAPLWPTLQTYTVRRMKADPTMIMIFLSCTGVLGFSSINLIMGIIGDAAGLRAGFLALPAMLGILLILLTAEKKYST